MKQKFFVTYHQHFLSSKTGVAPCPIKPFSHRYTRPYIHPVATTGDPRYYLNLPQLSRRRDCCQHPGPLLSVNLFQ